ncbi:MAG: hypothetical protein IKX65_04830 [Prevotella sp.]|nr:hypothetical protein [Prevotella sp.]
MINKIRIKNVKGYSSQGKDLNVNLDPTKINLCVAPNGFGKSSLATAFESLKRTRLEISEDNKHIGEKNQPSSLTLTIDGSVYTADGTKNEIAGYQAYVIHNRSRVDYQKQRIRNYVNVEAYLEIEDIDVCPVESPAAITYQINSIKSTFGANKKVLTTIDPLLRNSQFLYLLSNCYDDFIRFAAKKRQDKLNAILNKINALHGTEEQLRAQITDDFFTEIEEEENYVHFKGFLLKVVPTATCFDVFNTFFQLLYIWDHQKDTVKRACNRAHYERYKQRIDDNLKLLDTTGRSICSKELNGRLVVTYPHANDISNGQRDVLTFATELMVFKAGLRLDKKYILIIDEVFDYLDDANTMAAQYYLSQIVKKNQGNIYVVLLTHLNPYYFRNYIFNEKVINQVYLEDTMPVATQEMMKFIAFRQGLDKKNANDKALEEDMSCYIFHYNPQVIDLSSRIAAYAKPGVKSTWGRPAVFKVVLINELNKYFEDAPVYDPYAVALALRLRVEKVMYDKLGSEQLKNDFVETHKTNEKLKFCEDNNIPVPDAYFIVNAIHNSSDHLRENPVTGKFEEKAMVYKLQNGVIKNVLKKLFNYQEQALDVSTIS